MTGPAASERAPGVVSRTALIVRALIVLQGVVTVGMTVAFLPLGMVGVLVNGVLACASHGVDRRLFAGFAIAGAVVALAVGAGLLAVVPSGAAHVVPAG